MPGPRPDVSVSSSATKHMLCRWVSRQRGELIGGSTSGVPRARTGERPTAGGPGHSRSQPHPVYSRCSLNTGGMSEPSAPLPPGTGWKFHARLRNLPAMDEGKASRQHPAPGVRKPAWGWGPETPVSGSLLAPSACSVTS